MMSAFFIILLIPSAYTDKSVNSGVTAHSSEKGRLQRDGYKKAA